jgi:hypothetical protein
MNSDLDAATGILLGVSLGCLFWITVITLVVFAL